MISRIHGARRTVTVAALIASVIVADLVPAGARSMVEAHQAQRRHITRTIVAVHRRHRDHARTFERVITRSTNAMRHGPGAGGVANPPRWQHLDKQVRRDRWAARKRLRRLGRMTHRRVRALLERRASVDAWLGTWAILRTCPVAGPHKVADNFGITVRLPDVPVHRHMGNDVSAATGTPIVAPFPGYASASSSVLGGLEVRVTGDLGYAYNAHLSSYGNLGYVGTGDVIGYVGSTGDATGPHDHFEWHPYGGAAVDPNPYLAVSCD